MPIRLHVLICNYSINTVLTLLVNSLLIATAEILIKEYNKRKCQYFTKAIDKCPLFSPCMFCRDMASFCPIKWKVPKILELTVNTGKAKQTGGGKNRWSVCYK